MASEAEAGVDREGDPGRARAAQQPRVERRAPTLPGSERPPRIRAPAAAVARGVAADAPSRSVTDTRRRNT